MEKRRQPVCDEEVGVMRSEAVVREVVKLKMWVKEIAEDVREISDGVSK